MEGRVGIGVNRERLVRSVIFGRRKNILKEELFPQFRYIIVVWCLIDFYVCDYIFVQINIRELVAAFTKFYILESCYK